MVEGMRRLRLLTWARMCGSGLRGQSPWQQSSVEDDVFWESVSGCTDAVEVKLYIEEFGEEGRHVAEARACLEKLRKAVPDTAGKKDPVHRDRKTARGLRDALHGEPSDHGPWAGRQFECYREVQSLDPANRQAREGVAACIREVCGLGTCCIGEGERG